MTTREPFGYFRAEPFGWTDCAETDEGAIPLFDHAAIAALEHNYASLQQAFDEMKTLAAQRLEALKEAERQRDELALIIATDTGTESAVAELQRQRYELFAVLDCVSTNLKTGMSRRIQKLQAKTVDEKMFVIAAALKG